MKEIYRARRPYDDGRGDFRQRRLPRSDIADAAAPEEALSRRPILDGHFQRRHGRQMIMSESRHYRLPGRYQCSLVMPLIIMIDDAIFHAASDKYNAIE